jgi:dTDP-4-amino-4,6-dideoxygalactose transaminase
VKRFENLVEGFQRCKHAIATTSATTALHVALAAIGIKEGDEVIVPAFTHPSTANVVRYTGATPVFVDITIPDFNIDALEVEKKITKKTRAIIPVHLFGLPADMEPIMAIAKRFQLKIVEDAACALGAEYKGKKVGGLGDCGAFSFHPRKAITTGEGGMLATNDDEIAFRARALRSHGESITDEERHKADEIIYPEFIMLGFNYRMTDIQAAIGIEQMKKFPMIMKERRRLAARYDGLLADLERAGYILLPPRHEGFNHSYQSYVILLRDRVRIGRDRLSNELHKRGIATRKGTYHVPGLRYYREAIGFKKGAFPNSEIADERSLAIPLYAGMEDEDLHYVAENLRDLIAIA